MRRCVLTRGVDKGADSYRLGQLLGSFEVFWNLDACLNARSRAHLIYLQTPMIFERIQLLGLDPTRDPSIWDFTQTIWISFAFFMLREATEWAARSRLRRLLRRLGPVDTGASDEAFDAGYHVITNAALDALCWVVTLRYNGGCMPWSTDACLTGWPNHPLLPIQR